MVIQAFLKRVKGFMGSLLHAGLFYAFNLPVSLRGGASGSVVQGFSIDWSDKLKEIYLPVFQDVAGLLECDIVVLDVGARGRTLAQQWGGLASKVRFYGFELASPADCQSMAAEDRAMGIRSTYLPYAVSGQRETREFHVKRTLTGSSFYDNTQAEHIYRNWRVVRGGTVLDQRSRSEILDTITVETRSLDDLLAEGVFSQVDFIKVDAEGAELEILEGASQTLRRSIAVQLEIDLVERYNPGNHFFCIDEILNGFGFSLFDFPRFLKAGRRQSPVIVKEISKYHAKSAGQMIGADVIYLKDPHGPKPMNIEEWSVESLIKLAIIAFVSGQLEFALGTLQNLAASDDRVRRILKKRLRA